MCYVAKALIPQGDAGCHRRAAVTQCFPTQTACNVPRALQVENKSLLSLSLSLKLLQQQLRVHIKAEMLLLKLPHICTAIILKR